MSFDYFAGVVGAVILANVLSFFYVWALWRGTKHEKDHGSLDGLPWSVILAGIARPLVGGLSIIYAVNL